MIRVVLDANVLVSAMIRPTGPPGQVVRMLASDPRFRLVVTLEILAEYERVLFRPKIRSRLPGSDAEVRRVIASLAALGESIEPPSVEVPGLRDPKDAIYLAAAFGGPARILVSGDRDLTDVGQFDNVEILTPTAFILRAMAADPGGGTKGK